MNRSVLVTGAAGFIGSHLCVKLLELGYTVTGVDNFDSFYGRKLKESNLKIANLSHRFKFYELDVNDFDAFTMLNGEYDIAVHLAARAGVLPSISNPLGYVHSNISATTALLEWLQARKITKYIFASSSSVYGNNAKVPFSEEDEAIQPISPYAFSKRSCEMLNYTYHHLYDMDIINLRFFTVYGERQRPDLAIRKFAGSIWSGRPITIYGSGNTARDYTYISDTINGIILSIEHLLDTKGVFETINLGSSKPIFITELIEKIENQLSRKAFIHYAPMRAGDVNVTFADNTMAYQLIGYQPLVGLDEGMRRFINGF